jgi:GT2 family glycosyltransferase
MAVPFVCIVILNTNRREDTLACLASLAESTYRNLKTIVLDNHSTDGSVSAIQSSYPGVQIINLTENLGYAGNNNVGIQEAIRQAADWILVLNEDTILDPDCLSALVQVGESNPKVGIVGPMVYHFDEPDMIQSAGGKLGRYWQSGHLAQNELDRGQYREPHRVEWISGCAIMVRRAAIEQVGMLDANFFIYWEETEWCIRISRGGWQIVHVPPAKLWHKGVKRDYQPKPSFTYYGTRNHLLTLSKHKAPFEVRLFNWIQILRTLISWTVRPKWKNKREHRDAMWRGVRDFLQHRWGQMPS